MKKILYITILAFTFLSCEKVINVNLKNADPIVVVEGYLTNVEGGNFVSLSKTNSFYNNEEPERLKGAEVTIIDPLGNVFLLNEIESGYYRNPNFKIEASQTYKLEVIVENKLIESFSHSPSLVKIDSLKIEKSKFGTPREDTESSSYKVTCYFNDPINEMNFYRFRLYVNNDILNGFFVMDDKFFNGKTISYQFNGIELNQDDIVKIDLLGIDKNNYEYFYTLSRLMGRGQDITPGNPPSNIEGDAIGIFGANTIDSSTVVFY